MNSRVAISRMAESLARDHCAVSLRSEPLLFRVPSLDRFTTNYMFNRLHSHPCKTPECWPQLHGVKVGTARASSTFDLSWQNQFRPNTNSVYCGQYSGYTDAVAGLLLLLLLPLAHAPSLLASLWMRLIRTLPTLGI